MKEQGVTMSDEATKRSLGIFRTTVRLIVGDFVGTAFFLKYREALFLITNKHLIDADASFEVQRKDSGERHLILTRANDWLFHPAGFDLAAMLVTHDIFRAHGAKFEDLDITVLAMDSVLNDPELAVRCNDVEAVTLLGYPDGFYDERNYLPVARRGTTATPIWVDWNGKPEFLVDIAGFSGNSGGPVLLYDPGAYPIRGGGLSLVGRLHLVGVLWGVFEQKNLVACIKATKLPPLLDVCLAAAAVGRHGCIDE
jgi:hypothetical protein